MLAANPCNGNTSPKIYSADSVEEIYDIRNAKKGDLVIIVTDEGFSIWRFYESYTIPDGAVEGVDYIAASPCGWFVLGGEGNSGEQSGTFNVMSYGAIGDGINNDTDALQSALDAAGENRTVFFPLGTYRINATLKYRNGQAFVGGGMGGQFVAGQTTIEMIAAAPIFSPRNTAQDTANVRFENLKLDGGGVATIGFDFYRTSYSEVKNCLVTNCVIGMQLDANTVNQAYFNKILGSKIAYNTTVNVRCKSGANANWFEHNWLGGTPTSFENLSTSTGNVLKSNSFQGVGGATPTTTHIYLDAGSTVIDSNWIEASTTAVHITANGRGQLVNNIYGGSITNYVIDDSFQGVRSEIEPVAGAAGSKYVARLGGMVISNEWTSTQDQIFFALDRAAAYDTVNCSFNWGYGVAPATLHRSIFYDGTDGNVYIDHKTGALAGNKITSELILWTVGVKQGTGDPNGSVFGRVGHVFLRRDGGAGTSFYVKESGDNTNTGWVGK